MMGERRKTTGCLNHWERMAYKTAPMVQPGLFLSGRNRILRASNVPGGLLYTLFIIL